MIFIEPSINEESLIHHRRVAYVVSNTHVILRLSLLSFSAL